MYKFTLFALILFCFGLMTTVSAQTTLDKSHPMYEHDRITNLINISRDVPLSKEATIVLQNKAFAMKMEVPKMMRNAFLFKVLDNPKLSIEDRLWAADFFIKGAAGDISYPLEYLKILKTGLASQTK